MSPTDYLLLLLGTVALELGVVAWATRHRPRERSIWGLACIGGNLVTHPLAAGSTATHDLSWLAMEALVTAAEAGVYWLVTRASWPTAATTAVAANAFTAAAAWAWSWS